MSCTEWKEYKLDEVYEVSNGLSKKREEFGFGYEFLAFTDVFNNYFVPQTLDNLVNSSEMERVKCSIKRGDVFLTRTSEKLDELGRSCVALKDYPNATFNGFTKRLRPIGNVEIVAEYAGYYFRSLKFRNAVTSMSSMTTRASLNNDMISVLTITVPTLEEQEKIANILSSLDEKIELNNEMNKTLEEMAQSIFKRWFVNFEFPSEDGKPYKSSGGEMVDSELGMIPKGWEVKELSQLVNIITKSEKPFENEDILYEHFSIPALDSNKLPILEFGNSISSNKYKIDNDCILISKLNPNNKRIWNPYCNTSNSICSTEFIVYKAIHNYPKSYIYEIINSDEFTKFLVANATGSTGSRQRVKPKDTLGYKIVLPTIDKIIEIDKILSPIHKNIQLNTQESNTILQIRNTLLPKLMSGEIKVN